MVDLFMRQFLKIAAGGLYELNQTDTFIVAGDNHAHRLPEASTFNHELIRRAEIQRSCRSTLAGRNWL